MTVEAWDEWTGEIAFTPPFNLITGVLLNPQFSSDLFMSTFCELPFYMLVIDEFYDAIFMNKMMKKFKDA